MRIINRLGRSSETPRPSLLESRCGRTIVPPSPSPSGSMLLPPPRGASRLRSSEPTLNRPLHHPRFSFCRVPFGSVSSSLRRFSIRGGRLSVRCGSGSLGGEFWGG
ncbi:hypothetical protein KC19_1G265400 [Ceratodon purpureus]|uniref:Uncharacterized protein n=1 Tax=Ceratodon purpureus TaxID=3225 RepID=A0A8T0JBC8_CERPU|nr:hypothetical protein KC19_1G265400 [Ceratodon purpureus]